jgi:hypothetical protein
MIRRCVARRPPARAGGTPPGARHRAGGEPPIAIHPKGLGEAGDRGTCRTHRAPAGPRPPPCRRGAPGPWQRTQTPPSAVTHANGAPAGCRETDGTATCAAFIPRWNPVVARASERGVDRVAPARRFRTAPCLHRRGRTLRPIRATRMPGTAAGRVRTSSCMERPRPMPIRWGTIWLDPGDLDGRGGSSPDGAPCRCGPTRADGPGRVESPIGGGRLREAFLRARPDTRSRVGRELRRFGYRGGRGMYQPICRAIWGVASRETSMTEGGSIPLGHGLWPVLRHIAGPGGGDARGPGQPATRRAAAPFVPRRRIQAAGRKAEGQCPRFLTRRACSPAPTG